MDALKSHLNNRTQCVSVNGTIPNPKTFMSGVPQGLIFGPLLSRLFINYMSDSILNSTLDMYADDSLIYFCHKDVKTIETCLNNDIVSLSKWLYDNLTKENVSKTKVTLLGTSAKTSKINHVNVVMNNCTVKKVNTFRYPGVNIDANFKWNDYVSNVCRKMCN